MSRFDELAERMAGYPSRELGAGATESEIVAAETALGLPIRGGYRQFLRRFGWGGVEDFELVGLGSDVPPSLGLIRTAVSERSLFEPHVPLHLLPIMNNGGGSYYCLDTAIHPEPAVVFWDHEGGEAQSPEVVFGDFVSWLHDELDERDRVHPI